ncbi:type II CRISPR-associated endonuclease Cas1 [Lactobacillus amylovorus]|uniref:type II CRISPR-associated endonuclease Cas1 n=1 Tax=Lactobacillus amylovorus TaxID=1604 RepID=UPI003F99261C
MSWKDVFVTNPCKVSYSNNNVLVQTSDKIHYLNLDDLQSLIVDTPEAVLTSRALVEMAKKNVSVILCDTNYLPASASISCLENSVSNLKIKHQINWNKKKIVDLWTKIVHQKIVNQINTLKNLKIDSLDLKKHLDRLELGDATNQEGVVASLYFRKIQGLNFKRRDKSFSVNAALNYGYTVILNRITTEIASHGYLTQLGIHHKSVNNNLNLSCDFIEIWRFIIDDYVFTSDLGELDTLAKARIIDRLNHQILYNGSKQIVANAIKIFVNDCLKYLSGELKDIKFEVSEIEEPNNENASDV